MKKLLLSSLAALAVTASSSAFAADMRLPAKAPIAPPPIVTNWTGCYIDGGIGYGMYNQETSSVVTATGAAIGVPVTNGGRGWLGRVGGGCDYQFGSSWVIGAFADFDFMDLNGHFGDPSGPVTGNEKERDAWYAGGRLGYLISPTFLGYIDGGYTQTRFDAFSLNGNFVPAVPTGLSVAAHTYDGWFIGGGYEYALSGILPLNGLYWRTEYRFAQYQSANVPVVITATGVGFGVSEHMQKYTQTITSGLVWRFNFGGPVAARY